ncbi:MAG: hypothetical protein COB04_09790 [Gammaproteobacteria bacterium]|nr:MAG: hypothetical protein COB04_09790 [Gammaproteobacteria bacterium]
MTLALFKGLLTRLRRVASIVPDQPVTRGIEGVTCHFSDLVRLHQPASELLFKRFPRSAASISGEIRSLFRGQGMEFCESRVYQQGDDVRTMDWRVTARTTVPHVKVFQDEKERPVFLLVDQSPSMHFGSRRQFKSVQASKVAALLGWAGVELGDKVGGGVIRPDRIFEIKPLLGDKSILTLFKNMAFETPFRRAPEPGQGTTNAESELLSNAVPVDRTLEEGIRRVSQRARRGSLVFVISDFYGFDESTERALFELHKGRDVVLILVSDPIEKQILPAGQYQVSNGIDALALNYADENTRRKPYLEFFTRKQTLQTFCQQYRLRFMEVSTEQNELDALQVGILAMATGNSASKTNTKVKTNTKTRAHKSPVIRKANG